jgi:hypothetical protein
MAKSVKVKISKTSYKFVKPKAKQGSVPKSAKKR